MSEFSQAPSSRFEPHASAQPVITPFAAPSSGRSRRERNPAFNDPAVRSAMRGLREQLKEANKKTGDIDKDILELVVQPWMSQLPQLATLKVGTQSRTGRVYPSSQYGWLQNITAKMLVFQIVQPNIKNMVSNQTLQGKINAAIQKDMSIAARNKLPSTLGSVSKRLLGNNLRSWWVSARNDTIFKAKTAVANYAQSPAWLNCVKLATEAKAAGKTVSDYIYDLPE